MAQTDQLRLTSQHRQQLARELVRAWRGKRTQLDASLAIGYRSNVFSAWERGRSWPTASTALAAARSGGRDVSALASRVGGDWFKRVDIATREGIALLLGDVVGDVPLKELERTTCLSRHALTRYLNATAEPALPDFIELLSAGARLMDALDILAEPSDLPSFAHEWSKHLAATRAFAHQPACTDVLLALYLDDYRALDRHRPGWLAQRLGLSMSEEEAALSELSRRGLIGIENGRYHALQEDVEVAFGGTADDAERKRAWIQRQLFSGQQLHAAHYVALVSKAEAREIQTILRDASQKVRRIIHTTDSTQVMLKVTAVVMDITQDKD